MFHLGVENSFRECYIYVNRSTHLGIHKQTNACWSIHMGGLALMVISQKKGIFAFIYIQIVDYLTTFEV